MTIAYALDSALAALLLMIATWAIVVRATFAAVVDFVVYGLLLSLVWIRLSAVDVALTEAAIGSGVTGMLLLSAAARLRGAEADAKAPGLPMRLAAGALCALISVGLAIIIVFPANVAPTLAPMVKAHLAESGLGNPVAGVLFVYRSLDTLLEKVVLLLALVGVWSTAPDLLWGGAPVLCPRAPRDGVLVFLAQLLPPMGIMVGIYMFWVGADHPGGAFQGGTVLAAMWLLVMIAGLQEVPAIGRPWLRLLLVVGPVVFLIIGLAGSVLAGAFLAYPAGYAKPLIIIIEATLTLSIAVTLGLLAAGAPERTQTE
jgi:multisubunit Na+/H+ antiporter MnhB subunit